MLACGEADELLCRDVFGAQMEEVAALVDAVSAAEARRTEEENSRCGGELSGRVEEGRGEGEVGRVTGREVRGAGGRRGRRRRSGWIAWRRSS